MKQKNNNNRKITTSRKYKNFCLFLKDAQIQNNGKTGYKYGS